MGFSSPLPLGDWGEVLLDGWVVLCVVGFIGFAVFTDRKTKRRKKHILEIVIPQNQHGDKSTGEAVPVHIKEWMQRRTSRTNQAMSSSSSIGDDASFPSSNNSDRNLRVDASVSLNQEAQIPVPQPSPLSFTDLPPLPTSGHRVIFQTHMSGNFEPVDSPPSTKTSTSPAKTASASGPGLTRRLPPLLGDRGTGAFFPLLGRRLTREHSENSLNSLPPILRTNSGGRKTPPGSPPVPIVRQSDDLHGSRNSSPSNTEGSSTPKKEEINNIALEMDECSVCFKALYKEDVAVCANAEGLPTCLHIYHDRCIRHLRRRKCILCGVPFRYRRRLPDFDVDPTGWFQSVDVDRSGGLTPKEVSRVLAAQLPIDRIALEALLTKFWARWDHDKSGEIDQMEFFSPRRGLLAFIKKKRALFKRVEPIIDAPDIREDPKGWFEYFDYNKSDSLDKFEVLRGLIVSFNLFKDPNICLNLRNVIGAVWPLFDHNLNGAISKREFLELKTGLATSLIISLEHSETKRVPESLPSPI